MSIQSTCDEREWRSWCDDARVEDVYYTLEYAKIWESEEQGTAVGIRYRDEHGIVLYPVLQIPLDPLPGGTGAIDLRTAYDFGGPLAVGSGSALLLAGFDREFRALARSWRVVSEFARLHPFLHRTIPADAVHHCDNHWVDLQTGYSEVWAEYHPTQRGYVKSARRQGVVASIHQQPDQRLVAQFVDLYYATMRRRAAAGDYFFAPEVLSSLLGLPEMILGTAEHDGEIVAAACFLHSSTDLFYYLSASAEEALRLRPNNLLLDAVIQHAIRTGCARLHLGGGAPGLRHFKSQIGRKTVPYHVLKRVHDAELYRRLCRGAGVDTRSRIFPAYRARGAGVSARVASPPAGGT